MKANKVLKILNVTRPTLVKYVKDGTIRAARRKYLKRLFLCFIALL